MTCNFCGCVCRKHGYVTGNGASQLRLSVCGPSVNFLLAVLGNYPDGSIIEEFPNGCPSKTAVDLHRTLMVFDC